MQVNFGETEIKSVLSKLKIFNKEIGDYEMFTINEDFNYIVKLNNGIITLKVEELSDDIANNLNHEAYHLISLRFKSKESEKNTTTEIKKEPSNKQTVSQEVLKKTNYRPYIIISILLIGGLILFFQYQKTQIENVRLSNELLSDKLQNNKNTQIEQISDIKPVVEKTEQELRKELYEKEAYNPKTMLKVDYTFRTGLLGDIIVKGEIYNKASIAGFKNIKLKLNFLSKTDALIHTETITLLEFFPPNSNVNFEHRIVGIYNNIDQSNYKIISAEAY